MPGQPGLRSSYLHFPHSCEDGHTTTPNFYWLRWDLTFYLCWPQTAVFPIFTSCVARIAGMSFHVQLDKTFKATLLCLPSKHKALSSNPSSTTHTQKKSHCARWQRMKNTILTVLYLGEEKSPKIFCNWKIIFK
jgi:hypothetical protein